MSLMMMMMMQCFECDIKLYSTSLE